MSNSKTDVRTFSAKSAQSLNSLSPNVETFKDVIAKYKRLARCAPSKKMIKANPKSAIAYVIGLRDMLVGDNLNVLSVPFIQYICEYYPDAVAPTYIKGTARFADYLETFSDWGYEVPEKLLSERINLGNEVLEAEQLNVRINITWLGEAASALASLDDSDMIHEFDQSVAFLHDRILGEQSLDLEKLSPLSSISNMFVCTLDWDESNKILTNEDAVSFVTTLAGCIKAGKAYCEALDSEEDEEDDVEFDETNAPNFCVARDLIASIYDSEVIEHVFNNFLDEDRDLFDEVSDDEDEAGVQEVLIESIVEAIVDEGLTDLPEDRLVQLKDLVKAGLRKVCIKEFTQDRDLTLADVSKTIKTYALTGLTFGDLIYTGKFKSLEALVNAIAEKFVEVSDNERKFFFDELDTLLEMSVSEDTSFDIEEDEDESEDEAPKPQEVPVSKAKTQEGSSEMAKENKKALSVKETAKLLVRGVVKLRPSNEAKVIGALEELYSNREVYNKILVQDEEFFLPEFDEQRLADLLRKNNLRQDLGYDLASVVLAILEVADREDVYFEVANSMSATFIGTTYQNADKAARAIVTSALNGEFAEESEDDNTIEELISCLCDESFRVEASSDDEENDKPAKPKKVCVDTKRIAKKILNGDFCPEISNEDVIVDIMTSYAEYEKVELSVATLCPKIPNLTAEIEDANYSLTFDYTSALLVKKAIRVAEEYQIVPEFLHNMAETFNLPYVTEGNLKTKKVFVKLLTDTLESALFDGTDYSDVIKCLRYESETTTTENEPEFAAQVNKIVNAMNLSNAPMNETSFVSAMAICHFLGDFNIWLSNDFRSELVAGIEKFLIEDRIQVQSVCDLRGVFIYPYAPQINPEAANEIALVMYNDTQTFLSESEVEGVTPLPTDVEVPEIENLDEEPQTNLSGVVPTGEDELDSELQDEADEEDDFANDENYALPATETVPDFSKMNHQMIVDALRKDKKITSADGLLTTDIHKLRELAVAKYN